MPPKSFLTIPVRDDAREFQTFDRGRSVLTAFDALGVDVQGKRVVDLGAGYGSLSIACVEAGANEVLAVDINQDRLDAIASRASARRINVGTRRANLLQDWGGSGDADIAFLIGVVEYAGLWDDDAEVAELQRRVFRTALQVLRPGGLLVFASKNRLWPRYVVRDVHTGQPLVNVLPRRAADVVNRRLTGGPYRHHIHSPPQWRALIRSAGFDDPKTFVPYLSYQFPLKIVSRASFRDIGRLRSAPRGEEEWRVAWGRGGTVKAGLVAAAGTVGIQAGSSLIATAIRPIDQQ